MSRSTKHEPSVADERGGAASSCGETRGCNRELRDLSSAGIKAIDPHSEPEKHQEMMRVYLLFSA